MSIYCNCRYCVAAPAPELPPPPAPTLATDLSVIDFGCLVDEYMELSDQDFNLHWNAINKAQDKRDEAKYGDLYGDEDE